MKKILIVLLILLLLSNGKPNQIKGDIDNDGEITMSDVWLVMLVLRKEIECTDELFKRVDMNNDGIIDVVDLAMVKALQVKQLKKGK